ncbi:MAG: low molecular weight protein arginine phosphatase [Firmicutes bacterium]|nr:low molecular weight protein arginine phosphatase [Bacillota bacterium]
MEDSRQIPRRPRKVLVICTGNTCRSPMAEAMLREGFRSLKPSKEQGEGASGPGAGTDGIEVISAGLYAPEGAPASPFAVEVMKERGLDISGHRARSITRQLVEDADIILTMTDDHKRSLVAMYPEARDKVLSIKEFAVGKGFPIGEGFADEAGDKPGGGRPGDGDGAGDGYGDIADPYGKSIDIYRAVADEIGDAVERIISRFKGIESCGA